MDAYLRPVEDGLRMRESGTQAKEKLYYLKNYIELFESAMHTKWPQRNYVDLFSGPGKCIIEETGEILLGSPLLALSAQYPFTGYYFADLSRANISALRERCTSSTTRSVVSAVVGDCNQVVDNVVARLKQNDNQSLNLAFLDPEGFELRWSTVTKLASVRRMDLIINYCQSGLTRNMRRACAEPQPNAVDLFFGGDEWRVIYRDWEEKREVGLHRRLLDLYRQKLADLGYQDVRVPNEPLMRYHAKNVPAYRLLFASKHPLGEDFWAKVTRSDAYGQRRLFEMK